MVNSLLLATSQIVNTEQLHYGQKQLEEMLQEQVEPGDGLQGSSGWATSGKTRIQGPCCIV